MNEHKHKQDLFFNYIWPCHLKIHGYNNNINLIILFSILPDCFLILLQGPQGMRGMEGPEGHPGPDVSEDKIIIIALKIAQNDYNALNAQHLFIKCTSVHIT